MAREYHSFEMTYRYLHGSVCLYDGEPIYVTTDRKIYPKINLYKIDALNKIWKKIEVSDPLFDDRSPNLGYMNFEDNAHYLRRMPVREQNQGLRIFNVVATPAIQLDWFPSMNLYNCIKNIYPSYSEALDRTIKAGQEGCAFHRHVAIRPIDWRSKGLYYRTRLAAVWNDDNWNFIRSEDSTYLEKIIKRSGMN